MWPFFIHLPETYYYSEPVTGAMAGVPFVWLALLPLFYLANLAWKALDSEDKTLWKRLPFTFWSTQPDPFTWLLFGLGGAALLELGVLLLFISSSMRYEMDFLPTLILFSGLVFYWAAWSLRSQPLIRGLFYLAVWVLTLATLLIGLLMGFSSENNAFVALNPNLYYALVHFFRFH